MMNNVKLFSVIAACMVALMTVQTAHAFPSVILVSEFEADNFSAAINFDFDGFSSAAAGDLGGTRDYAIDYTSGTQLDLSVHEAPTPGLSQYGHNSMNSGVGSTQIRWDGTANGSTNDLGLGSQDLTVVTGNQPDKFRLFVSSFTDGDPTDDVTARVRIYSDSTATFSELTHTITGTGILDFEFADFAGGASFTNVDAIELVITNADASDRVSFGRFDVVPEPSSMLLLGAAVLGGGVAARRRRKRAKKAQEEAAA